MGGNDVRSTRFLPCRCTHESRIRHAYAPPALAPVRSSPVSKDLIQHKRDQVQAFDDNVQQLGRLTPELFLECLRVSDIRKTQSVLECLTDLEAVLEGLIALASIFTKNFIISKEV
jgi:hypothetical protein